MLARAPRFRARAIRYGVQTPAVLNVNRGPGITRSSVQDVLPAGGYRKKIRNAPELVAEGGEDEDGEGDGDDDDEAGVTSTSTQRIPRRHERPRHRDTSGWYRPRSSRCSRPGG